MYGAYLRILLTFDSATLPFLAYEVFMVPRGINNRFCEPDVLLVKRINFVLITYINSAILKENTICTEEE